MASLSDASLPMGLVFFGLTVFGFLRRKSGHALAIRDFPALARELGLEFKKSPYKGGIGQLSGTIEGLRVIVDPDEQRAILVRFARTHRVEISSYENARRPPKGLSEIRLESPKLRSLLKTVRVSGELEDEVEEWLRPLVPLLVVRERKNFAITERGISVQFEYGSPPFIPAPIVRDVVPLLVTLARKFEARPPGNEGSSPEAGEGGES